MSATTEVYTGAPDRLVAFARSIGGRPDISYQNLARCARAVENYCVCVTTRDGKRSWVRDTAEQYVRMGYTVRTLSSPVLSLL